MRSRWANAIIIILFCLFLCVFILFGIVFWTKIAGLKVPDEIETFEEISQEDTNVLEPEQRKYK